MFVPRCGRPLTKFLARRSTTTPLEKYRGGYSIDLRGESHSSNLIVVGFGVTLSSRSAHISTVNFIRVKISKDISAVLSPLECLQGQSTASLYSSIVHVPRDEVFVPTEST